MMSSWRAGAGRETFAKSKTLLSARRSLRVRNKLDISMPQLDDRSLKATGRESTNSKARQDRSESDQGASWWSDAANSLMATCESGFTLTSLKNSFPLVKAPWSVN